MTDIYDIFFNLIQVALGNKNKLLRPITPDELNAVFDLAKSQTLEGICFYGIKSIPSDQLPNNQFVKKWAAKIVKIQDENIRVTQECKLTTQIMRKYEFYSCIMKGQSLLKFYPVCLRQLRESGDVDVWVQPTDKLKNRFADHNESYVERFLMKKYTWIIAKFIYKISKKQEEVGYHHMHCCILPQNMIEVHITPSFCMNPFDNHRLQKLFDEQWKLVEYENQQTSEEGFYSLPLGLNVVFLIAHFYRHLILEGVGMRQLMDFYFVLKAYIDGQNQKTEYNDSELVNIQNKLATPERMIKVIKHLGMFRITSAMMWVMQECFGMEDKYLLCDPSERYGRHLLQEMIEGGNFGHENQDVVNIYNGGNNIVRFLQSCKCGMRLFLYYPREVVWVPFNNVKQSIIKNYFRRHPVK